MKSYYKRGDVRGNFLNGRSVLGMICRTELGRYTKRNFFKAYLLGTFVPVLELPKIVTGVASVAGNRYGLHLKNAWKGVGNPLSSIKCFVKLEGTMHGTEQGSRQCSDYFHYSGGLKCFLAMFLQALEKAQA